MAPSSGIAIETKFRMNCTGWVDTDLPLLYELAYFTDVLTTVVCRKKESFCDSSFPVGDGTNSSLNIRIRVFDKFGMFSELYHNVKVLSFYKSICGNFENLLKLHAIAEPYCTIQNDVLCLTLIRV